MKLLRTCIFCGEQGNISKEHLFGLWLREFFPRNAETTHDETTTTWEDRIGPHEPASEFANKQGHVGAKRLRVVCKTCNNGWLSQLEKTAKKVLPPLIAGQRAYIMIGAQRLLSTWAAKTSMVAEYLRPTDAGVTQSERTFLMQEGKPPDLWFAWAAAIDNQRWGNLGVHRVGMGLSDSPVSKPSDAPYYGQCTTFGLGHILFCVASGNSPALNVFAHTDWKGVVQIWPPSVPRTIVWPPAAILSENECNRLSDLFNASGFFKNTEDPGANWTPTL